MGQRKEQRIGIFDSGIGGFSILKEIHKIAPHLNVFYVADSAFAPYGDKAKEDVISRSKYIVKELISFELDLIVVACNTATAMAIDSLREEFDIPFVGVEPFVNAISKLNLSESDKSCVITTELMSKSERFNSLKTKYDPKSQLDYFVTHNLASLIEEYYVNKNEVEFKKKLENELLPIKDSGHKNIILGCTHYPLVSNHIEEVLDIKAISPCPYVAERVSSLLSLYEGDEQYSSFQFSKTSSDGTLRFVSKDFSNLA